MQNIKHDKAKLVREIQAKTILTKYYNERYPKIIKIEEEAKPDLVDLTLNVGIEVVLATVQEKECLINDYKKQTNNDNEEDKTHKTVRNGVSFVGRKGKLTIVLYWADYHNLLCQFNKKLDNLNTKYYKCGYDAYDLYIKAESVGIDDEEITPFLNDMILSQKKCEYQFRYVYIQYLPNIYCFDLHNNKHETKTLKREFCEELEILT